MGYIKSNKCPCCGGTNLVLDCLGQYSHIYRINKNGKPSKKFKYVDQGSMDCAYVHCRDCGWNSPDADGGTDEEGYLLMKEEWYEEV